MQEMTAQEVRAFLLDTARTGKLGTVREDGRPHVAPIWFDLDGDGIVFTTWYESVKARNMRRDPRMTLCVDDENPPFAFVLLDGVATLEEHAADLTHWATRIAGRYMGQDQAEAFGKRNSVPGEWLVRVRVTRVVARKGISDW
jgi:PPOX class probable F420-dependent enzyme